MADVYLRSNYQDFQRFQAIDLAITGDVEASLPVLTELVRAATSAERRRAFDERGARLGVRQKQDLQQAREDAAVAWNAAPVTTARLAMELWDAVKSEPWSLAVSDRIPWARRLWPTTRYEQMLGGSGGQGVGYGAPGAVGVALANKAKGLLTVTFQPDGDLLYAPGALWTAAHHKIPLLFVMHNNRAYHQEVMMILRMASRRQRVNHKNVYVGTLIDNPAPDYAKIAQGYGLYAQGPVSDPKDLAAAIKRGIEVVKKGEPALIDVVSDGR
jgi:acetolactate synthase I/II/III large subunit